MNKSEIIERLKNIAGYAVHTVGEAPFVMSLDDGIAVHEAIELLEKPETNYSAIPISWIEAYADWLTTIPAPFAANDEKSIRAMMTKWKTNPDLQTPRCNEDTCSL